MLDAGPRDADGVAFLERVLADRVRRHLARQHDHRDRVHVRGRDAGDRVGDARARGDEADAHLGRRARVAVRRVDRALLVPDEHVLDLVLLEQLVVDVEDRAARVAEDVLDAFFLEAADDDFRTRELHGYALRELVEFSDASGARSRSVTVRRELGINAPTKALPGRKPRSGNTRPRPEGIPADACGIAKGAQTAVIAPQHRPSPAERSTLPAAPAPVKPVAPHNRRMRGRVL